MKAIITVQNADGTYDEVGMNNRTMVSHLKSERGILKWAKEYANVRKAKNIRLEFFGSNIYKDAFKTIVVNCRN